MHWSIFFSACYRTNVSCLNKEETLRQVGSFASVSFLCSTLVCLLLDTITYTLFQMTSSSCDSFLTRIKDTAGVSVRHLQCAICQDLLWKPVECADCRKLYCEKCVLNKLLNTSEIEPPCQNYIEGECHPVIINQLSCLRIACIHQPNGCPEVRDQVHYF